FRRRRLQPLPRSMPARCCRPWCPGVPRRHAHCDHQHLARTAKEPEEEIGRLRTAFAEAFAAHNAYKEMPYAIRRRRSDAAPEERVRLSETLREIQGNLSYHLAWTKIESETVGKAYEELVQELRKTAGAAMHAAWEAPPIESDTAMNIPPAQIDLSALQPLETAYIAAVRAHLRTLKPWWSR
ncbi:hypothetical protein SAMN05428942_7239, partial [Streptomyces sp. 2112.2]